jgi:hypothetical protein
MQLLNRKIQTCPFNFWEAKLNGMSEQPQNPAIQPNIRIFSFHFPAIHIAYLV